MVVHFVDRVTGVAVYVNPEFVVSIRPDPQDPLEVSLVRLNDGETIRANGDHVKVAEKLGLKA